MCVFVSHPMNISTFPRGNGETPNGLLIFRERETIREIVEDFDGKSYNNYGKPWKSSRILRVKPNFCILIFRHFFFFLFLIFFIFVLFRFVFFSIFSFSFFFFFFFFLLWGARNLNFFCPHCFTISYCCSFQNPFFSSRLGWCFFPLRPLLFFFFRFCF